AGFVRLCRERSAKFRPVCLFRRKDGFMTPEAKSDTQPNPGLLFDTFNAYQRSQALKAGIEIGLFSAIAQGNTTIKQIAAACKASERGTRILSDYLVIIGFLTKQNDGYRLTPDSAMFLDQRSPAYLGTVVEFLLSPNLVDHFDNLTESVKKGGSASEST